MKNHIVLGTLKTGLFCMKKQPKLTLESVRAELSPLGVTIVKDSAGEYKVRLKGSPNGHGYFTPDLDDALATGKLMASDFYQIQTGKKS